MGIAPFLVASSIQAVMAQRLIRHFCAQCKSPTEPDRMKLKAAGLRDQDIDNRTFYTGVGCDNCRGTGFRGRKGIFELMVMNNRLRDLAFNKAPTEKIREQAINDGMNTLFQDGVRKVLDGWTTIDEILKVAIDR
jgi:type IV pilus assembly protein PilB